MMRYIGGAPRLGVSMIKLLLAIAMCVLGTGAQSGTVPTSLPAGYSITIANTASANTEVLASTSNYILSLEGKPCAITVRHLYSNPVGHLFWVANYYVGSLVGATKCTMTLTKDGDLQLIALFTGTNTTIWHSNTAGKGVASMAFEDVFDSGDLQLLSASKQIVYHSFGAPDFAIAPMQKFSPGETLVAPNAFFNDATPQVLFSGGIYTLKLQSGDLRLYSNFGLGEKEYWSLNQTLYKGDLSQVAYAGIVTKVGGIGLFKQDGTVVYTTGPLPLIGRESNPHDTYFSVDPDGNLRTHYLVKGEFWADDFQALPQNCDLPSYCGAYGVCSKNTSCSCPASFKPNNSSDLTQGCKPQAGFSKCGSANQHFIRLTGYDYIYNQYATSTEESITDCEAKCLKDCACLAYFYNSKSGTESGTCYISNEVRTLTKVTDNTKLAFIKL